MSTLRWVGWNVFLAVIPVVLAYVLGSTLGGRGRKRRLPPYVTLPLALVWLAFLPNTCYLLTEWRHLLFDRHWSGLLDTGAEDGPAMLATAKWALFFLLYSGTGVMLFVLGIRPMERWFRAVGGHPFLVAPPFFMLVSLGVYLGLRIRLNSWDLVQRPAYVWRISVDALSNPTLLISIAVFAALLWGTYEAVDLWADGIVDRLQRWGLVKAAAKSP